MRDNLNTACLITIILALIFVAAKIDEAIYCINARALETRQSINRAAMLQLMGRPSEITAIKRNGKIVHIQPQL